MGQKLEKNQGRTGGKIVNEFENCIREISKLIALLRVRSYPEYLAYKEVFENEKTEAK